MGPPLPQQHCSNCYKNVSDAARGKYVMSVKGLYKFFCQNSCERDFRKRLKMCSYCEKDVRNDPNALRSSVSGELKDFCSQTCLKKYEKREKGDDPDKDDDVEIVGTSKMTSYKTRGATGKATCSVCGKMAPIKHEVNFDNKAHKLCGEPCFAAFRFANKLSMNMCENCGTYCYAEGNNPQSIQFEGSLKKFCSIKCIDTFKKAKHKIVACAWCHTKKSNFDMIERVDANNKYQMFCTLNCLSLYRVNLQATSNQNVPCDQCRKMAPAQYHLTMSDASVRNFCSYNCVMAFQGQFTAGSGANKQNAAPNQQKATVNVGQKPTANTANQRAVSQAGPSPTPTRQSTRQANRGNYTCLYCLYM